LQKGDYETAVLKADELCSACGKGDESDPYGNSVRQVRSTFDSLGVEWPTTGPCASDINDVAPHPSQSPTVTSPSLTPSYSPDAGDHTQSNLTRITFVDGFDGLWSTLRSTFYTNNPIIECPIGGTVIFHYPNFYHDVTVMADEQHYNNCDFQGSTVLAPLIQNEDFGSVTYYHNCTTPGQVEYLSCSIPGHCEAGQKIMVKTSPTVRAQDEVTGEWLMHVHSLNQVLRVLGQRYDPSTGLLVLDRGFQTEVTGLIKHWNGFGVDWIIARPLSISGPMPL
jgi:Plastocyanin-like domain.